jgi:hypothetical protein
MILYLFAKSVCQARKAAHVHTQIKVLPFDVACRNMLCIWIASDWGFLCACAFGGAVFAFHD